MPKNGTNSRAPRATAAKTTHRKGAASAVPAARKPRHTSAAPVAGGRDKRDYREDNARPLREVRNDRPARDSRPIREQRNDRPARSADSRPEWSPSGSRESFAGRNARTGGNASRAGSDSRSPRREWTPERPARDDRAPRREWTPERPARDDRAPRREWTPERPQRDDRAPRRDDRAPRREWTPERPARDDRAPRREWTPERPARDDRAPRREWSDSRPARDDRGSRDPRRSDRMERDDNRQRSFDGARDKSPNKKAFFEDVVLEKLQSVDQADAVISAEWEEMGLHPRLLETLVQMGAISPFPIQQATIPAAISGRDVLGRGKTGSGKTIAFAVPLITKLVAGGSQPRKPNRPRALIVAPTRELADQIDRTLSQLARAVGFYTTCIYGGMPQRRQEIAMARGVDILVATPGRLEDLMAQKIVDLRDVETLVIDEADHMCDLGFIEPVKRITAATGDSQKMLFSATLDREIDALVKQFLPNPYVYEVPNETEETSDIIHRVMFAETDARSPILLRLVQGEGKAIIFTRTKMTAERLSESLTSAGVPAARLHGDLNQNQRNRNLQRFMSGEVRVLVATDVAARGIHVDDIAMVIQVDPPEEYKTYLHRSGRTGRAGKTGTVITLVPRSRRRKVEDLLRRAERDAIYMDVRQDSPILAEIAGPIAPAPAASSLDFGDSRGGSSREG
ncbi:MAG: DEAD/DEAH box helicase, partial [Rhodoluna sp.]|nr:DEAD/DEAH box helicase [Rhodoluna sp.]